MKQKRLDIRFKKNNDVWVEPDGIDFDGTIYASNQVGSYFAEGMAKTGDCILLFSQTQIFYKKKFESGVTSAILDNYNRLIFLDDEGVLRVFDPDGKSLSRKNISDSIFGFHLYFDYCVFTDGEFLWIFNCSDLKMTKKNIESVLDPPDGTIDYGYATRIDRYETYVAVVTDKNYAFFFDLNGTPFNP